MDMPYIPITKPERQMDAVWAFCENWQEPVSISYEGKKMVVMTWEYYLENFCVEEDRARLEKEVGEAAGK